MHVVEWLIPDGLPLSNVLLLRRVVLLHALMTTPWLARLVLVVGLLRMNELAGPMSRWQLLRPTLLLSILLSIGLTIRLPSRVVSYLWSVLGLRRAETSMALMCNGPLPLLHLTAIRAPLLGCRRGILLDPCILARWKVRWRVRQTGSGTSMLALLAVQLNTMFRLLVFRVLHCLLWSVLALPLLARCVIFRPTLVSRLATVMTML